MQRMVPRKTRARLLVMLALAGLVVFGGESQTQPASEESVDILAEIESAMQNLSSPDLGVRKYTRVALAKRIEELTSNGQPLPSNLLQIAVGQSNPQLTRIGIADVLGRLPRPWTTEDLAIAQRDFYSAMEGTTDPSLRWALDRALMNSEGLYRDGINDLNNDNVSGSAREKFRRTIDEFPESGYVERAQYYLGYYELRSFLINQKRGIEDSRTLEEAVEASNSAFDKIESEGNDCGLCADSTFFKAINFLLIEKVEDAIVLLQKLESEAELERDPEIYVYQLVFGNDKRSVIDNYVLTSELAEAVREYVEAKRDRDCDIEPQHRSGYMDVKTQIDLTEYVRHKLM